MSTARFLAKLRMEDLTDANGEPLTNRDGRQLYRLLDPLPFYSADLGIVITAPTGFITDLDSTPRVPVIYLLLNGFGNRPAVVHDYLYSNAARDRQLTRAQADGLLREACIATGVPKWKANLIYAGVRLGGGTYYDA